MNVPSLWWLSEYGLRFTCLFPTAYTILACRQNSRSYQDIIKVYIYIVLSDAKRLLDKCFAKDEVNVQVILGSKESVYHDSGHVMRVSGAPCDASSWKLR